MGTRSLTFVTEDEAVPIMCMYRQFDGYPQGHGKELYEFLKDIKMVNGLGGHGEGAVANGAGCLAAQIVAHFKEGPGGIYLYRPNKNMDCWQDYEYWISVTANGEIIIRVYSPKFDAKNLMFSGTLSDFDKWINREEKMSWKPVSKLPGDPKWYDNAQRFATKEEAMSSASARFMAWSMPEIYDAHESDDPVNYARVDDYGRNGEPHMTPEKARKYLDIAKAVSRLSKDQSTQVGALVLGPAHEIRSVGYNGAPRGCCADEDSRGVERPEKYYWFSHAELNAITNAARVGTPLEGSVLVVTHFPCMDCARAIVQAGIKKVYYANFDDSFLERWEEHIKRAMRLFDECGVEHEAL